MQTYLFEVPLEKLDYRSVSYNIIFYSKVRKKKIARVSYNKGKFLFFGGKMLQRQNVPATKRLGT